MDLCPGARLGDYALLLALERGGMGSVWLASLVREHGFQRLFAVKTILPQYAEDLRFRQMFYDEARVTSRIHHPNTAAVVDVGECDGVLYLVMEWIDGESLYQLDRLARASGAPLRIDVVLRALVDACAGLHAAHEQADVDGSPLSIVHRDLSPQNVLVTSAGAGKVIDFGVARAANRHIGDTASGSLKGKLRFAAPEQVRGGAIDRRADVWGVGATLRFLVTGEAPFGGDGEFAVLAAIYSGASPTPLPASVPRPIARIIDRALALDPAERYPTALALQRDLEAAAAELDLSLAPERIEKYVVELGRSRAEARRAKIQCALAAGEQQRQALRDEPVRATSDVVPWQFPVEEAREPSNATADSVVVSSFPRNVRRGVWRPRVVAGALVAALVVAVGVTRMRGGRDVGVAATSSVSTATTAMATLAGAGAAASAAVQGAAATASASSQALDPSPSATALAAPSAPPVASATPLVARPSSIPSKLAAGPGAIAPRAASKTQPAPGALSSAESAAISGRK